MQIPSNPLQHLQRAATGRYAHANHQRGRGVDGGPKKKASETTALVEKGSERFDAVRPTRNEKPLVVKGDGLEEEEKFGKGVSEVDRSGSVSHSFKYSPASKPHITTRPQYNVVEENTLPTINQSKNPLPTSPHHTTPSYNTPHHTTPSYNTPHHTTPSYTNLSKTTPSHTTIDFSSTKPTTPDVHRNSSNFMPDVSGSVLDSDRQEKAHGVTRPLFVTDIRPYDTLSYLLSSPHFSSNPSPSLQTFSFLHAMRPNSNENRPLYRRRGRKGERSEERGRERRKKSRKDRDKERKRDGEKERKKDRNKERKRDKEEKKRDRVKENSKGDYNNTNKNQRCERLSDHGFSCNHNRYSTPPSFPFPIQSSPSHVQPHPNSRVHPNHPIYLKNAVYSHSKQPLPPSHNPRYFSTHPNHPPIHPNHTPIHPNHTPIHPNHPTIHPNHPPIRSNHPPIHSNHPPIHPIHPPIHPNHPPIHSNYSSIHQSHPPIHHSSQAHVASKAESKLLK